MPCTAVERRPRSATAAAGADAVVGIMMVNFSGCYWIIRIFFDDDDEKELRIFVEMEGGDARRRS